MHFYQVEKQYQKTLQGLQSVGYYRMFTFEMQKKCFEAVFFIYFLNDFLPVGMCQTLFSHKWHRYRGDLSITCISNSNCYGIRYQDQNQSFFKEQLFFQPKLWPWGNIYYLTQNLIKFKLCYLPKYNLLLISFLLLHTLF